MNLPTTPHQTPGDARRAASLILLRDGVGGLEVLMLRRAEREGDMRSGVAVFPGGVLDPRDREAHACVHGADDVAWSGRLGLPEGGLDYAIAALRETFEEAGLLLARGADGQPIDPAVAATLAPWRDRLQSGEVDVPTLCRSAGLTLDLSGLHYYSHWLTPPGTPKRFDTRFFIAAAPEGQQAVADFGEAVELMWLRPAEALSRERGLKLLTVTEVTLKELSAFADTAAALAAARSRATVPLVMPRRAVRGGKPTVVLPHELPYAEIGRLDPAGRADAAAELVPGRVVWLSPRVARITAPNPGPMTGPGTNSYLVGSGTQWVVIDPGPTIDAHLQVLQAALGDLGVKPVAILATHTHRDHSPAAAPLAAATGAPVWGRLASHPMWQDDSFCPDHQPADGERLVLGDGVTLHAVHTPGHASNHLCWWLEEEALLFTGDHLMQGSTVVINPPDGDMAAYLQSLRALRAAHDDGTRALHWLAPGHGFLVAEPPAVIDALVAHRLKREAKVVAALQAARADGPLPLEALVPRVYDDVPAALHGVAARSLLAHLLKLATDGQARQTDGGWSAA
jgi:glyoxylase-like metal-dependent hydrolase (beta-lactamase superfamily II)/8-oxo-dGTP pyrophosphatase MutT (NUDIX family)